MSIPKLTDRQRELFGNRTFGRALYVFSATIVKTLTQQHPGGEVNRTGETVRGPILWSVVAPSQQWANFAFKEQFDGEFTKVAPMDLKCEVIPICAQVSNLRHG